MSLGYSLLVSDATVGSKGSIAVIGDPKRCILLSDKLLNADYFDNVTGSYGSDGLPDFAGETVQSIMDYANAPYEGYIAASDTTFLKELNVRNALDAIYSKCSIGPNDREHSMSKNPAKMIIFVSSYVKEYGLSDIEQLFSSVGIDIPILISESEDSDSGIIKECFRIMRKKNMFTHGVFFPKAKGFITYPIANLADEAYEEVTGNFTDTYRYNRVDNLDNDTYVLVGFSERYLSQELIDYLQFDVPEMYMKYVQN